MTGLTAVVGGETRHRVVIALCIVPITFMVVLAIRRGLIDLDAVRTGNVPDSPTDVAYAQHPWPAYAHILPAMVYLVGAPL
jgi:hypothetical protein